MTVFLCSTQIRAYDFEVDGIYYNIVSLNDLTAAVTSGDNSYSGNVVIPDTVVYKGRNLKVVEIGTEAFRGDSELKNVTIPNTVKTISAKSFYSCINLANIVIGDSVEIIGGYAFYNCSGLKKVTIPNSVTEIHAYAFYYCESLGELYLEDGEDWLYLGGYYNDDGYSRYGLVFGKTKSKTLYLGRNVCNTYTSYSTFSGLSTVTIGNSVTCLGDYIFDGEDALKNVYIPSSVKEIGNYTFRGCTGLTRMVIPSSVKSIGKYAFYGCSNVELFLIGDSVTNIGDCAFSKCSKISYVLLPNSVEEIGGYAFSGCTNLNRINIPSSVTSIKKGTFSGCTSLTKMSVAATTPPEIEDENFTNFHYLNLVVKVPVGSLAAYQSADVWKNFWDIQEDPSLGIGDNLIMDVKNEDAPIYNLQGVEMKNVDELPHGIYIQNGKKRVIN